MKTIHIFLLILILASFSACFYRDNIYDITLSHDLYLSNSLDADNRNTKIKNIIQNIIVNFDKARSYPELDILNPYNGTIFPLDVASPEFFWADEHYHSTNWLVTIGFEDCSHRIYMLTDKTSWTPGKSEWEVIKAKSIEKKAVVTIFGINSEKSFKVTAKSSIMISTSKDEVGAPIFYKQVPPHFLYANRHPKVCQWRLGDVSSYRPPHIVLEKLPVCGNCHSFSRNGKIFGMDIDYKKDKGAYVLTSNREKIELSEKDFITWNDFPKKDNKINMGLFSRISPDGNYVVSTVHEKNFMALINDLNFSQLFFTAKGILAYYSMKSKKFLALPGADDPDYVHTSPAWSPDGRYVVFSRAKVNKQLLELIDSYSPHEVSSDTRIDNLNQKYQIQYDLYRLEFNNGKGGIPKPIKGASHNGMSNYCARYSPDGNWIVFNQSKTGLLLQPDSQLYILPGEGGIARKMNCNTDIMNSWHSWSPNGRWIVFSSKINTPFTELFLTHIDENGKDSPPVKLIRLNSLKYAANIPEFAHSKKTILKKIRFLSSY